MQEFIFTVRFQYDRGNSEVDQARKALMQLVQSLETLGTLPPACKIHHSESVSTRTYVMPPEKNQENP